MNEIVDQGVRNLRNSPQYAYIAPTYGQAERIAWAMLKNYTKHIPGVEYNEAKLRCIIPRPGMKDQVTIYLLGGENPDSIRGMYFDGVVLDEFAEMDPRVWGQVVRPALADRRGWAVFIGTPKGQNHFYDVYKMAVKNLGKGWFTQLYKASETGVLPQEELDAMRLEMSDDEYEQELECSFTAALIGAYWGKQMSALEEKKCIGNVPHDPALQVDTFWDLGINDTTCIWFVQQCMNEVRIIDHVEMSGQGLEYYAKLLKGQGEGNEHRKEYTYREHNWPHDGAAKELGSGVSRKDTMRNFGIRVKVHPKYDVADGINAVRLLLPRCRFDLARTGERGVAALKNYQKKWDAKNKIWMDSPLHNWASHSADGMRLLAMAIKPGDDGRSGRKLPETSDHHYNIFAHEEGT